MVIFVFSCTLRSRFSVWCRNLHSGDDTPWMYNFNEYSLSAFNEAVAYNNNETFIKKLPFSSRST